MSHAPPDLKGWDPGRIAWCVLASLPFYSMWGCLMQTGLLCALLACPIALTVCDQSWVWAELLFKLLSQGSTGFAPSPIGKGLLVPPQHFASSVPFQGNTTPCVFSHVPLTPQAALPYLHCCLNYPKSRICLPESQSPSSSAPFPAGAALLGHSQLYFLVLNPLQVAVGASTLVWEQQHPSHSQRVSPVCVSCCFNCLQSE